MLALRDFYFIFTWSPECAKREPSHVWNGLCKSYFSVVFCFYYPERSWFQLSCVNYSSLFGIYFITILVLLLPTSMNICSCRAYIFVVRRYCTYQRTLCLHWHLVFLVCNFVITLSCALLFLLFSIVHFHTFMRMVPSGAAREFVARQQLRVIEFRVCNARLYFLPAAKNSYLVDEMRRDASSREVASFFIVRFSSKNSVIIRSREYISWKIFSKLNHLILLLS